jgi:cell fate (sporulation/competence/biofilm development) regulator YmcA (YheA/YmcA/DUF963 family)
MSGGTFDYSQYRIIDIIETIQSHINRQGEKIDYKYVDEHQIFEPDVLKRLQDAIKCLKKAYVYAQRVDRFLAGDDGDETFIWRLDKELNEL